jgi:hypothetical protein
MAGYKDIGHCVLDVVLRSPGCDMEDVLLECPDFTWNQVFLALDRLSRLGHVALKQTRPCRYSVTPGNVITERTH